MNDFTKEELQIIFLNLCVNDKTKNVLEKVGVILDKYFDHEPIEIDCEPKEHDLAGINSCDKCQQLVFGNFPCPCSLSIGSFLINMSHQLIGYVRASSQGQNTARQLVDIKLDRKFTDIMTGNTKDRAELKSCLEYVRDGDTLIVDSIDRLARCLIHLQESYARIWCMEK